MTNKTISKGPSRKALSKSFKAMAARNKKKYAKGGVIPKYQFGGTQFGAVSTGDLYGDRINQQQVYTQQNPQLNTGIGDFGAVNADPQLMGGQGAFDWQGATDMTGGLQQQPQQLQQQTNGIGNAGYAGISAAANLGASLIESTDDNMYNNTYGYQGTSAAGSAAASTGGPIASAGASVLGMVGSGIDQLTNSQEYNEYGVNTADGNELITKGEAYAGAEGGFDQMGQLSDDVSEGNWGNVFLDLAGLSTLSSINTYRDEQDEALKVQKDAKKAEALAARQLNEQTPQTTYTPTLTYPDGGTVKGPIREDEQTAYYNNWLSQRQGQLAENMTQQDQSFGQKYINQYLTPEMRAQNEYNRQTGNVRNTPYFTNPDTANQYIDSTNTLDDRDGSTPYYYSNSEGTRAVFVPEGRDNLSDEVHEKAHSAQPRPQEAKIRSLQNTEQFYNSNYNKNEEVMADPAYYNKPGEINARLMELRYNNKIDPKKDPSLNDIRGYRVKNNAAKDEDKNALFEMYDNQQLETLLKEVAENAPQKENDMMIAAYGGRTHIMPDGTEMPGAYHGDPNAELETKEVFRTPDGSIEKVPEGTPSHANGGIKMSLPDGTEILGKMKGKHTDGKRYKDLGQGIKKRYDKYEKAVTESKSPLSKRTAQRMLDKVQIEFDALMDDQEMQKGINTHQTKYAKGGVTKYAIGTDGVEEDPVVNPVTYKQSMKDTYAWWDRKDQTQKTDFSNLYSYVLNNPELGFKPDTEYLYGKELGDTFDVSHDPAIMRKTNRNRYDEYVENTKGGASNLYNTRAVAYQLEHDPKYSKYAASYADFLKNAGVSEEQIPTVPQTSTTSEVSPIAREASPVPLVSTYDQARNEPQLADMSGSIARNNAKVQELQGQQQGWWNRNANTLGNAAQFAPAAYNMYQGIFGKEDYLNAGDYRNPYEGRIMSNLRDKKYNIKPQLEMNELAYQTGRRNVRQMAPGAGGYLSNVGALAGTRMRADSQAWAQKQNMENQWRGQDAGVMAQLGAQRSQTDLGIAQYNAQVDAAKQGALSTSIDQLAGAAASIGTTKNQRYNDELTRRALEAYLSGQSRFNLQ